MEKTAAVWLLLVGLNFALAADTSQYFMEGGKLTLDLRPPSSEPINYILWKFDGNLLGEWVKGVVDLTYYSTFLGRTILDTSTGRLEISRMTKADVGVYSVEINNKLQPDQYKAVLIKEVPQPQVIIRPLSCGSTPESCTATCEGNTTDAGPVTYSWKMGDGEWKESVKNIDITKADTADVKTFTCRVKNPLTEKESEPENNPLFGKNAPGGLSAGKIVGIIFGVLIGAAAVGIVVAWCLKLGPFSNRGSTSPEAAAENGETLKENPGKATATEERQPLKENPGKATATEEKQPLKENPGKATAAEERQPLKENPGKATAAEERQPLKDNPGEDTAAEERQPLKDTPGEDTAAEKRQPLEDTPGEDTAAEKRQPLEDTPGEDPAGETAHLNSSAAPRTGEE